MTEEAFGERSISKSQVNRIKKLVREGEDTTSMRGKIHPSTVRTKAAKDAVEAVILDDRRSTMAQIEAETGLSHGTVQWILEEDLGLVKKSARWVPRLLSEDQKLRRLQLSLDFVRRYNRSPRKFLGSIITMDESVVAFHTPETKEQSKQWLPKGTPGPLKARVQASRKKQMVFAFFDTSGLIYQHYAKPGAKINAKYLIEVLDNFLGALRRKQAPMALSKDWILHWDNSPLHTACATKEFLQKKGISTLDHPLTPRIWHQRTFFYSQP